MERMDQESVDALISLANSLIISIEPHSLQVPTFSNAEPLEVGVPEFLFLAELDGPQGAFAGCGHRDGHDRPRSRSRRALPESNGSPNASSKAAGSRPATAPSGLKRARRASATSCRVPDLDQFAAISTPRSLRPVPGGYEFVGHDGERITTVTWPELLALREITEPIRSRHNRTAPSHAGAYTLGDDELLALFGRLAELRIIVIGPTEHLPGYMRVRSEGLDVAKLEREQVCQDVFSRFADADDAEERAREEQTGVVRPEVVPVAFDPVRRSRSALIMAYAKAYDGGRLEEHYEFRRDWVWLEDRIEQHTSRPAIYLFSNYIWSHAQCIEISSRSRGEPGERHHPRRSRHAEVRGRRRATTSRQPARRHHGARRGRGDRGEVLDALMAVIGDDQPDLSVLADVPGHLLPRRRRRRPHRRPGPHRRPRHHPVAVPHRAVRRVRRGARHAT